MSRAELLVFLGMIRLRWLPWRLAVRQRGRVALPGRYLIGTKKGLFQLEDGVLVKTLRGEWYGVTFHGRDGWGFVKAGKHSGWLVKFRLDPQHRARPVAILRKDLSPGCHQIDWYQGDLYLADTYNNRILKLDESGNTLAEFYPKGALDNGRQSDNYAHINSLLHWRGHWYLVCHNETSKTGRNSAVLKMTDDLTAVLDEYETQSGHAHNVAFHAGKMLHCNSQGNALVCDQQEVVTTDHFTRGLSVSDAGIVMGGSEYAKRSERTKAKGAITWLSESYSIKESARMPAMVQEIRRLDRPDYALSQFSDLQAADV